MVGATSGQAASNTPKFLSRWFYVTTGFGCLLWVSNLSGEVDGASEVLGALKRSARVILAVNVTGFLVTAVTGTHKVTDLFVSIRQYKKKFPAIELCKC